MWAFLSLIAIPVLYDHPRLLVVSKPQGVPCSPVVGSENDQGFDNAPGSSVLSLLREQRSSENNNEGERLYQVHRLDAPTSGILVFAKDREAAGLLQRGFMNRSRDRDKIGPAFLTKYYLAVTARRLKKKMGVVRGKVSRGRGGGWMMSPETSDGLPCTTR